MAKPNVPTSAPAPAAAPSREFPKVLYHLKKGAKKVVDTADEVAHKALGYSNQPPAPAVEEE